MMNHSVYINLHTIYSMTSQMGDNIGGGGRHLGSLPHCRYTVIQNEQSEGCLQVFQRGTVRQYRSISNNSVADPGRI